MQNQLIATRNGIAILLELIIAQSWNKLILLYYDNEENNKQCQYNHIEYFVEGKVTQDDLARGDLIKLSKLTGIIFHQYN